LLTILGVSGLNHINYSNLCHNFHMAFSPVSEYLTLEFSS
jgi:hypothetical protein